MSKTRASLYCTECCLRSPLIVIIKRKGERGEGEREGEGEGEEGEAERERERREKQRERANLGARSPSWTQTHAVDELLYCKP